MRLCSGRRFQSVYGGLSNDQYVDQLLRHTGIIWTQGERAGLVNGLTSGTLTRAGVLGQIAAEQRFVVAKRNEEFVLMEYFGYFAAAIRTRRATNSG